MKAAVPIVVAAEIVSIVPYELIPRAVRFLACRIDAGFPSPAADDLEEPVDLAAWLVQHPAASYVMRVQGWSMAAANITDGDHVVVDRSIEPRSGHIVVALVHGDRTLKRLRRREDRMVHAQTMTERRLSGKPTLASNDCLGAIGEVRADECSYI